MKSDKKEFCHYLINYINNNLDIKEKKDEALDELVKLVNYIDKYSTENKKKIKLSIDSYSDIFKDCEIITKIIRTVIGKTVKSVKQVDMDNITCNNMVLEIIEAYCVINNIIDSETTDNEMDEFLICGTNLYLKQISSIPPLSEQEKFDLPVRIINGDMIARNRFFEGNLRLVAYIAIRQFGRGRYFDDIIQEGNIGLYNAINKYDYTKGYQFSTYATWWIRHNITRYLANNSRTIRLPVYVNDMKVKLNRIKQSLSNKYGREATTEEIAIEMNMSVPEITRYLSIEEAMSIDQKIMGGNEKDLTYADVIPNKDFATDNEAFKLLLKSDISKVLTILKNDKQKIMIALRYNDKNKYSLEECGTLLGVSRQRAMQIEEEALYLIRKSVYIKKLADYMEDSDEALDYARMAIIKEEARRKSNYKYKKKTAVI